MGSTLGKSVQNISNIYLYVLRSFILYSVQENLLCTLSLLDIKQLQEVVQYATPMVHYLYLPSLAAQELTMVHAIIRYRRKPKMTNLCRKTMIMNTLKCYW